MLGRLSSIYKVRILGSFLAIILVCLSVTGIVYKGLNLGIDFSGGYITEFSTSQSISIEKMTALVEKQVNGKYLLNNADENTYWVLRQEIIDWPHEQSTNSDSNTSTTEHQFKRQKDNFLEIQKRLFEEGVQTRILDSDFLDSQLGAELLEQGGMALLTALIVVLLYLSTRFEWRFAVAAIVALFHDLSIILGVFAWLQIEFNLTVLASMLAIIGYSLNDSIVVADRIRERLMAKIGRGSHVESKSETISDVIDNSVKSTLTRTLITSGTTLATVSAVWLLAGLPLFGFSVALFGGILVGTLSSISIAATLPQYLGLTSDFYLKKQIEAERLAAEP